jgi:hypothetical protein
MVKCLQSSALPVLFILSGRDYVAREFEQVSRSNSQWMKLMHKNQVFEVKGADHTFSSAASRDYVAQLTAQWCKKL